MQKKGELAEALIRHALARHPAIRPRQDRGARPASRRTAGAAMCRCYETLAICRSLALAHAVFKIATAGFGRIKRSLRKSYEGFPALGNLVSFVTSRLPVNVMFLPKCARAPSGDGDADGANEGEGRRRGHRRTDAAAVLSSRHIAVSGPLFCDA